MSHGHIVEVEAQSKSPRLARVIVKVPNLVVIFGLLILDRQPDLAIMRVYA
jgi:hypothetical protein